MNEHNETQATETAAPEAEAVEMQWLEPSNVGSEYRAHLAAMEPTSRLPIDKAFGLPAGFNVGLLREIAEDVRGRKIVVIEHGEHGFEIRRLPDNANVRLFYKTIGLKQGDKIELGDKKELLEKVLSEFLVEDVEKISAYDPKAVEGRSLGLITYSYLHRRLANLASFKSADVGATKALKAVIQEAEQAGYLAKLSTEDSKDLLETTAAVYRINKSAIEA
ncbi:hypothetical protein FtMidnight_37 [Enterobacteria phage FtMidnight]